MRAVDIIRKKRDGHPLTPSEIDFFIAGTSKNSSAHWPHYQLSALLMAIVLRGMNEDETAHLTSAMVHSGVVLDWSDLPGVAVDKHSTGGVGDKTSLILAPLAAACGVYVPMMSGRGLGHTGGTLDKLESIPGFRVNLTREEMYPLLRRVGCVMLSATEDIAPADRILYALRDVTATVESIPLIASSIMSKKLAEGIKGLILDVKYGSGAFMKTPQQSSALARAMVQIGKANGVRTQALLTPMNHPLGYKIGNSLEVLECMEVLSGQGPVETRELSILLTARMVFLGGVTATLFEAEEKVRHALTSGRGLEKFREMVEAQGGDPHIIEEPERLPIALHREIIRADRSGYLERIEAEHLGRAVLILGAGRNVVGESVDHGVGAVVLVQPGEQVTPGTGLVEIYYRDRLHLEQARHLVHQACHVSSSPPDEEPLVLDMFE